ncbi:hypothetical protein DXG01_003482 [Tephrocybe rancida]|nr:hypothetical protein DXG01_003482 [Tephrocybe rancida]
MSLAEETPFNIAITDAQLSSLNLKLALTTYPDEIDEAAWEYGAPLADVKRLVSYWKNGFDWRKQEAALNAELPQFTRDLDVEGYGTFNIHYVHKKSEVKGAIPLLFVHGWPGSFIEVRKILPLLIKASPDHPSFHVVAISLPGFGFSTGPTKKGFNVPQYAEITRQIAQAYGPNHSKAWHTNFPMAPPPTTSQPLVLLRHTLSGLPFLSYSKREQEGLQRTAWFQRLGRGYYAEQSTRPQTIGYSLADSPAGLLAWIYEKLVEWTDNYKWEDDEVLTWISVYYFSRAGPAASVRIYYEAVQAAGGIDLFRQVVHTKIPVGYSYFPKELAIFPRSWTRVPNLVFEAEHDEGGHFAAHEKPELLVGDLRKMFGKGGRAFGVVNDKNGYDA